MRKSFLLAICGFMVLATGAAFADSAQVPAPQPVSATTSQDAPICKVYYHEGTLIRTNTCYTRAEWDAQRHYAQNQIRIFQQRTSDFSSFR
jgi:hypothetical protein